MRIIRSSSDYLRTSANIIHTVPLDAGVRYFVYGVCRRTVCPPQHALLVSRNVEGTFFRWSILFEAFLWALFIRCITMGVSVVILIAPIWVIGMIMVCWRKSHDNPCSVVIPSEYYFWHQSKQHNKNKHYAGLQCQGFSRSAQVALLHHLHAQQRLPSTMKSPFLSLRFWWKH